MRSTLFGVGSLSHFLVILAFLEGIGLSGYLAITAGPAFSRLIQTSTTPAELSRFFLSSPDRILVATGLAVLAYVLVNTGTWESLPGDGGM